MAWVILGLYRATPKTSLHSYLVCFSGQVFYDCLRQYPGPMRLLVHQYGPAQVLYVALVKLRTYHKTGLPPSRPGRVAAEMLVEMLKHMDPNETYEDIKPGTQERHHYRKADFQYLFEVLVWVMVHGHGYRRRVE